MLLSKISITRKKKEWSYGGDQTETINYRTGRSERSGLFDERILGQKKITVIVENINGFDTRGICEKCGVK